jgi:hypothetical protein
VREDLAFAVLLLAPLAAWRRAPRARGPAGAARRRLAGRSARLIIPYRTPELLAIPAVFFRQYLGSLGQTPGEVVRTLIAHPLVPLKRLLSRRPSLPAGVLAVSARAAASPACRGAAAWR